MSYTPSKQVLERYADVLVNFALGGGAGIAPGDVVRIASEESGKPLYAELHRAVWRAGGHTIGAYSPDEDANLNLARDFYEIAGDAQVDFFASQYWRGLVDWLRTTVLPGGKIAEADLDLIHLTDDVDEAVEYIVAATQELSEQEGKEAAALAAEQAAVVTGHANGT